MRSARTHKLSMLPMITAIALVVGAAAPAIPASAATSDIDGAANAKAPAQRGQRRQVGPVPTLPPVANPLLAGCDSALLQRLTERAPTVAQWIMVTVPSAGSTTGQLSIVSVRDDVWQCTLAPTAAMVGRSGTRPLVDRRSGDGTTPSGLFALGVVQSPQGPISFFGNSADPGALGPYRRVQPGDCYGANPNTAGYGHWRVDSAGCVGDDELLSTMPTAYEHAVIIGANTEPNVSGDAPGETPFASAIFLHRTSTTAQGAPKPTSGCVSISHAALVAALRTIDPALDPHFAIGTRAELMA